jgi:hypothetical protein
MGTRAWLRGSLPTPSPRFTERVQVIRSIPMSLAGSLKWNGGSTGERHAARQHNRLSRRLRGIGAGCMAYSLAAVHAFSAHGNTA